MESGASASEECLFEYLPNETLHIVLCFALWGPAQLVQALHDLRCVCRRWKHVLRGEEVCQLLYESEYGSPFLPSSFHYFPKKVNYRTLLEAVVNGRYLVVGNFANRALHVRHEVNGEIVAERDSYEEGVAKILRAHGLHNVDTLCFASSTGSDGLPPLPPREDYDVILFFSNGRFLPTEAADLLGDYLYEFVQDGKGVVQAVFSVCSGSEALGGKWWSERMNAITTSERSDMLHQAGSCSLPAEFEHDHPIFTGITQFTSRYRACGEPHEDGNVLARFSDGLPFVVDMSPTNVLCINVFPPCMDHEDGGWRSSDSNGAALMANALVYAHVAFRM